MSKECAFQETCPMGPDIINMGGACATNRGETCGRAAAYAMLRGNFDGLEALDRKKPIVGTFAIETVPAGVPPVEVRRDWVGVTLPIRQPERLAAGSVYVSPADAILSLLKKGRLDSVEWFMGAGLLLDAFSASWRFRTSEGTVNDVDPVTSREFYGAELNEQVRRTIDTL